VSWRYLVGVLEIFDQYPRDIWYASWRYLMCPGDICGCPGDIWFVSWRYFLGVLEKYGGCPGDI